MVSLNKINKPCLSVKGMNEKNIRTNNWMNKPARKHSSKECTTRLQPVRASVATTRCRSGEGMFKWTSLNRSSVNHQTSVAALGGGGKSWIWCRGGGRGCGDLSHDANDVTYPPPRANITFSQLRLR